MFIVFLSEIELVLANPRILTLWAEAGAFRHPAVVCHTTTMSLRDRIRKRREDDDDDMMLFIFPALYLTDSAGGGEKKKRHTSE